MRLQKLQTSKPQPQSQSHIKWQPHHFSPLNAWLLLNSVNKKSTYQGKGFALAAVMFVLLITAIISATAVKTGLLNENLAQSQNQIEDARQNAELTLKDGIDHVLCKFQNNGTGNSPLEITNNKSFTAREPFDQPTGVCVAGLCGDNQPNQPVWQTLHQNTPTVDFARYGQFTKSSLINQNLGRYLIEAVQTNFATGSAVGEYQYRITAVGFSAQNPTAQSRVYKKLQVLFRPVYQRCSYDSRRNSFPS